MKRKNGKLTPVSNWDATHRLERGLEEVVGEEVPAKVEEGVYDVDLPVGGVAVAEDRLGLGVARVDGHDQGQACKQNKTKCHKPVLEVGKSES